MEITVRELESKFLLKNLGVLVGYGGFNALFGVGKSGKKLEERKQCVHI